MSQNEICRAYLDAVRTLYGDEFANASDCYYGRGWYYIGIAHKFPDVSGGYVGGRTPYRRKNVEEFTQELLKRIEDRDSGESN